MATKYARAGGGNWTADATWSTTSGGAADTTKPTAADDAVIDAASGNVTIDSGAVCRSLDCNGYTGTLTHNSTTLTIGDGTAGAGNRALRLASGMTYTNDNAGVMSLASSSATQQTITTAGKTLAWLYMTTAQGSWVLTDSLTMTRTLQHTIGTFDTGNQTVICNIMSGTGSQPRTLTLGSSAITVLTNTIAAWDYTTVTNLTVSANTATVTCTGAGATFASGTFNWNGLSLVMSGSGICSVSSGTATLANFTRTGTAVKTDELSFSVNMTVTGSVTITGNSATNRVLVRSSALGTTRSLIMTGATLNLTNCDMRDIAVANSPTIGTVSSVGNALGNTGITFTTPVTRYAVATGNVSGTGTWSATSGGASGASVPLCHDTIVLNAASGSITVTNDMPRMCADLTCTGFMGTLALSASPTEFYGSITLGSGMTISGAVSALLYGRSNHTITSAGKTWPASLPMYLGTYTLTDALIVSRSTASAILARDGATFNDGGFSVTLTGAAASFGALAPNTVNASGTWTIASTTDTTPWNFISGTLNHTGTIVLSGATATDRTFAGGGKTYGTLTDQNTSTGKLTITGQNTFATINKTAAAACTLALPTSSGITVTNSFNVNGILGALLTLTGDVTKVSGIVSCDYLNISSSDAAGGATFYAGANSTDGGSNTGWVFGAPTGGRPFKGGAAIVTSPEGADTVTTIEGALVVL